MATLPGTQLNYEAALLERLSSHAVICGAEIWENFAKKAFHKATRLKQKFPHAKIGIANASFAEMIRNDPKGFHSVWYDACGPLQPARYNSNRVGVMDVSHSIDDVFDNPRLFAPAFKCHKPGQFFITVMRCRDNVRYIRQLASRQGISWSFKHGHGGISRVAAVIEKVQEAAKKQHWYALPCLALLYSGETGWRRSPMAVVGFNVHRPRSDAHRRELMSQMRFCKGRIQHDTIDLNNEDLMPV